LRENARYIGSSDDIRDFDVVKVEIKSNVGSATEGVEMQFSDDDSTWFTHKYLTYNSGSLFTQFVTVKRSYFRLRYTNGATNQRKFRVRTTLQKNKIKTDDQMVQISTNQVDRYGDIKVADSNRWETMLDIKHTGIQDTEQVFTSKTTGATISHSVTNGTLSLTTTSNSHVCISQSRRYIPILNGRRTRIEITAILNGYSGGNQSGTRSRVGLFDNNDGIFYEYNGENLYIYSRKNCVDTEVIQTSWNIDQLNGEGLSKVNLDLTVANTWLLELNWNGLGDARMGVNRCGIIYYTHYFNMTSATQSLLQFSSLPIRCEIRAVSENGNGELNIFGMSASVETGYISKGSLYSVMSEDSVGVNISDSAEYVMLALRHRLSSTIPTAQTIPLSMSLACKTETDRILFKIYLYKGVPSTATDVITDTTGSADAVFDNTINPASNLDVYIPANDETPELTADYDAYKTIVYQGYFATAIDIDLEKIYKRAKYFDISKTYGYINGTAGTQRDMLVITCKHTGIGNTHGNIALNWSEIY
jgi:hypothetical protein